MFIELFPDDDIVSIQDQLNWLIGKENRVIFILPNQGDLLTNPVDLRLLRRHADNMNIEVGFVTTNVKMITPAEHLGFPTFPHIFAAEKAGRRIWLRGRRQRIRLQNPTPLDQDDRREMYRRHLPLLPWQKWLFRYLSFLIFCATISILIVTFLYSVPKATIHLQPETISISIEKTIVADPQLQTINFSGASVPGRLLKFTEDWQAMVETTGLIEISDASARGKVIFINQLEQPVRVPAGTRVTTSSGGETILFQTIEPVDVPGAVGGTAEVSIIAIKPGPESNVGPNQINKIEGTLALQLRVRNLDPVQGGGTRQVRSVTEADIERLRSQVLQQLQSLALQEMEAGLSDQEFLARDSLRIVAIHQETYSHFPNEQTDQLILSLRAELQATAVDETEAFGIIFSELSQKIPNGYLIIPDTIQFQTEKVMGVDSQGRVSLVIAATAMTARELPLNSLLTQIAGQETAVALTYLHQQLPLQSPPTAEIWPPWFNRIPYSPVRIQTVIDWHTP